MKLLLENGAKVNAQCGHYGNALYAASAEGYEQVVKLLVNKGADVNAQGGEYGNALCAASEGGSELIVKLLVDMGINVNAQVEKYGNALQIASARGYEQVVKLLLGKYKTVEEMDRRALEGSEKALGKEHPDTLTSASSLTLVLQYQGKYEAVEEMFR